MLFIVPTPIGNFQDMTFRSIKTLQSCDLILAEDTRKSGHLLKHFDIDTPMQSFHTFNEHSKLNVYIEKLKSGSTIALISDAGTPAISDPGFLLIRECVLNYIKVSCLPGPTAFVPALVSSAIPSDKFFFEGFLPHKKGRQKRFLYLAELPHTFILYESPHRLCKCLEEIKTYCGDNRKVCVAREISKIYEEIITDNINQVLKYYQNKSSVKGEFVIVVEGKTVIKEKNRNIST